MRIPRLHRHRTDEPEVGGRRRRPPWTRAAEAYPIVPIIAAIPAAVAILVIGEMAWPVRGLLLGLLCVAAAAGAIAQIASSRHRREDRRRFESCEALAQEKVKELEDLAESRLQDAIRDHTTGAYNSRFFEEAIGRELYRSIRYHHKLSIAVFDIDDFKVLNDQYGHQVGDRVLSAVTATMSRMVRPSDVVARIGGEEFAVLLPETTKADAFLVAERIRIEVAAAPMHPERRITISGGVACAPDDADVADVLVARADAAMYLAKAGGKNSCSVFTSDRRPAAADGDEGAPLRERGSHDMLQLLHALVASIDAKAQTPHHSENVAYYGAAIGKAIGLSDSQAADLRLAGLLHDVGKVGLAEHVLVDPLAENAPEHRAIRRHAEIGAAMIERAGLADVADWVRHHHERANGAGYPHGLSGDAIPVQSRALHVAEAFDTLVVGRPYREAVTVEDALEELERHSGTQFDTAVVTTLSRLLRSGEVEPRIRPATREREAASRPRP